MTQVRGDYSTTLRGKEKLTKFTESQVKNKNFLMDFARKIPASTNAIIDINKGSEKAEIINISQENIENVKKEKLTNTIEIDVNIKDNKEEIQINKGMNLNITNNSNNLNQISTNSNLTMKPGFDRFIGIAKDKKPESAMDILFKKKI